MPEDVSLHAIEEDIACGVFEQTISFMCSCASTRSTVNVTSCWRAPTLLACPLTEASLAASTFRNAMLLCALAPALTSTGKYQSDSKLSVAEERHSVLPESQ
jgi:hypothetical protein